MIRKLFFITSILLSYQFSFSQIGGVSASKLSALCLTSVSEGNFEFEPAIDFYTQKGLFDNSNKLIKLDTFNISSGFGWRFTSGLKGNKEIGFSVPNDMSEIGLGFKSELFHKEKYGVGFVLGVNSPLGERSWKKGSNLSENSPLYAAGLLSTIEFNSKLSLDMHVIGQKYLNENDLNHNINLSTSVDLGYYFRENLMSIIGVAHSYESYNNSLFNNNVLSLNYGFAFEFWNNFLVILAGNYDLYGKNTTQGMGFAFALTTTIN